MGEARNCKFCGAVFNYTGDSALCINCQRTDEGSFQRIREYLYTHPMATIYEVATVLDISIAKIKIFLREDRLEIVGDGSNLVLDCEMCGRAIKSGRLCGDCTKEIQEKTKELENKLNKQNKNQASNNGKNNNTIKFR